MSNTESDRNWYEEFEGDDDWQESKRRPKGTPKMRNGEGQSRGKKKHDKRPRRSDWEEMS